MHLVRPVDQPQRARPRVEARQRRVLRDAGAAVDLDRAVDDVAGGPRGDDLDRGDLGAGGLRADGVDLVRRREHEQARLVDLHARLGDRGPDEALVGERPAERLARARAVHHEVQRALGHPDRAHAVVDPARAEPRLGDREAAALLADEVRGRHAHVVELELDVAVLVGAAEHRMLRTTVTPGASIGTRDRVLPVARPVRVRAAEHDRDLAALVGGAGDEPLARSMTYSSPSRADRVRMFVASGGDVRLGHREAGADLALEQRHEPALLLLGGAEHASTSMLPVSGAPPLSASGAMCGLRPVISARCA